MEWELDAKSFRHLFYFLILKYSYYISNFTLQCHKCNIQLYVLHTPILLETAYYNGRFRLNGRQRKNVSHWAVFTKVVFNSDTFSFYISTLSVSANQHLPFISVHSFCVQCQACFSKTVVKQFSHYSHRLGQMISGICLLEGIENINSKQRSVGKWNYNIINIGIHQRVNVQLNGCQIWCSLLVAVRPGLPQKCLNKGVLYKLSLN